MIWKGFYSILDFYWYDFIVANFTVRRGKRRSKKDFVSLLPSWIDVKKQLYLKCECTSKSDIRILHNRPKHEENIEKDNVQSEGAEVYAKSKMIHVYCLQIARPFKWPTQAS